MAKKVDKAGHWLIKANPLSKEGVYMYSGKVIDPNNANGYNLEPDKLYPVYRPAAELKKACESFNGVQIRNEHEMMGDGAGMQPADSIPTGGTVFNVKMDGDTMVGDMRIFGNELRSEIEGGKKELSLGYFCRYRKEKGKFGGKDYEFVQYELEGNHVALVKEGRMGSSVRVFDSMTFDSVEIPMKKQATHDGDEQTDVRKEIGKMLEGKDEDILAKVKDAIEGVLNPKDGEDEGEEDDTDGKGKGKGTKDDPCPHCGKEIKLDKGADEDEDDDSKSEDEDEDADGEDEDEDTEDCGDKPKGEGADSKAMDMKEVMRQIAHRDRLADGVADVIGAFDHSEMTVEEVATYACDKLELPTDGDCVSRVEGFIAARKRNKTSSVTTATDAAEEESTFIKDYLK